MQLASCNLQQIGLNAGRATPESKTAVVLNTTAAATIDPDLKKEVANSLTASP